MFAAIDNWIFVVLAALAGLFQLISKAKRGPDSPDESTLPPPDQNTPRRAPQSSQEEQIRKFLEALGQPRTAKPPPPLPPRTDVAPRPVAPVQPPPSMIPVPKVRRAKPSEAKTITPPVLPKRTYEPVRPPPPPIEAPEFESVAPPPEVEQPTKKARRSTPQTAVKSEHAETDLVQLLRTSGGLRQAFVLREILGPPRSVQPLQDLPGTA